MAARFLKDEGVFMAQVLFSGAAMAFSIGMLARGEDPAMYLPVLTATLGYWTPSPRYGQQAIMDSAMASALHAAAAAAAPDAVEAPHADVQHPEDDVPVRILPFATAGSGEARISVGPIAIRATRTI